MKQLEDIIFVLSHGKRRQPESKKHADGKCGICDKPITHGRYSQFYCDKVCDNVAQAYWEKHDRRQV